VFAGVFDCADPVLVGLGNGVVPVKGVVTDALAVRDGVTVDFVVVV